jgi:hypothetical protein
MDLPATQVDRALLERARELNMITLDLDDQGAAFDPPAFEGRG